MEKKVNIFQQDLLYTADELNAKVYDWLKENGKVVYGSEFCSEKSWYENQSRCNPSPHKAILVCIEPIEACTHPKESVSICSSKTFNELMKAPAGTPIYLDAYQCTCGVRVTPKEFEALQKIKGDS